MIFNKIYLIWGMVGARTIKSILPFEINSHICKFTKVYTLQNISAFLKAMQKEKHTGSSMCWIKFSVQTHIDLHFI